MKGKINDAANELFGPVTAKEQFSTMPGRLLRNRWTSVDECEEHFLNCIDNIGPVFKEALGGKFESRRTDHQGIRSTARL